MATFIDTHAHLDHPAFDEDREELLSRVRASGVERVLCPAIGFDSNERMMEVLRAHEEVSFAVGIHPLRVLPHAGAADWDLRRTPRAKVGIADLRRCHEGRVATLETLEERLQAIRETALSGTRVAAIGETGLDFSRKPGEFERDVQRAAFRAQVDIALTAGKPLVLHVRDAHREAADILHSFRTEISGTVHCFCQGPSEAKEFLAMGLCLGIGGKVTYSQNARLREALGCIPVERIVLETDAPFVVPSAWPSRRNDPTAIPGIASELAHLRSVDVEELAEVTTQTARRLFFGDV